MIRSVTYFFGPFLDLSSFCWPLLGCKFFRFLRLNWMGGLPWFSWIFLSMLVQKEVLISIPRHPIFPWRRCFRCIFVVQIPRVWMFRECVFRVQWIIDFLLYPVMPGGKMKPHHLLQEEHPLQVWNFNLLEFHIPN